MRRDPIDTDPFFADIAPLRDVLLELMKQYDAMCDQWAEYPAAESHAMAELDAESKYTGAWGNDPVRRSHHHGALLLFVAEDHIRSIARLFNGEEPVPTYGHIILARAVLEACGRAGWLLEPGIGARGRVARTMTEELANLAALQQFPRPAEATGTTPQDRRAAIVAEAERQKFQKRTRKNSPPAIEQWRPSNLTVVAKILEVDRGDEDASKGFGKYVYRYHCAVAHGTMHGLRQSMQVEPAASPLGTGDLTVALVTDSMGVNTTMAAVVLGFVKAVNTRVALFGWTHDGWSDARTRAMRTVRAKMPKAATNEEG